MFPGERFCPPDVRVVLVLVAEHDGAVTNVAHVDLPASDEGDAGGGTGGAGQATGCLGPLLCNKMVLLESLLYSNQTIPSSFHIA